MRQGSRSSSAGQCHDRQSQSWYRIWRDGEIYVELGRPNDRDYIFTLGEDPGNCDLAGRRPILLSNLLKALGDLVDIREVLLRVPRNILAEVDIRKLVRARLCSQSVMVYA